MSRKNKINLGQKYWNEAKKVIPGGTMLFSKTQTSTYQKNGQHIFQKPKVFIFGI